MEGGWQNNRQSGLSRNNRMVENIFEELDALVNGIMNRRICIILFSHA